MSTITAVVLRTDNTIEPISYDRADGYNQICLAVDGSPEPVPVDRNDISVYCNEEGKIRRLPRNHLATNYTQQMNLLDRRDYMAGNVVVVGFNPADGTDQTLPPDLISLFTSPEGKLKAEDAEQRFNQAQRLRKAEWHINDDLWWVLSSLHLPNQKLLIANFNIERRREGRNGVQMREIMPLSALPVSGEAIARYSASRLETFHLEATAKVASWHPLGYQHLLAQMGVNA